MSLREPPAAAPGISPGRIEELVLAMILLICEMLLQVYSNTGLGGFPSPFPPIIYLYLSLFPCPRKINPGGKTRRYKTGFADFSQFLFLYLRVLPSALAR